MNKIEGIEAALQKSAKQLLDERNQHGYWDGELSSSALGVAVSLIALHFYDEEALKIEISKGLNWLASNANSDGGFGDSPESLSNTSTSLLCYAALHVTSRKNPETKLTAKNLAAYLLSAGIDVDSPKLATHVLDYYQGDYTFSVPILATCALCGIPKQGAFEIIPQLPFELALMPRGLYRFLNLSVVSYAIPALVAVGIAIFRHKQSGALMKFIRKHSIPKAMALLEKIMPQSGGFLEAMPLTAFVSLSLIKSGFREHVVVQKGIGFLKRTQRADGSWPIDIDLSTWVTTLAVKSFGSDAHNLLGETGSASITKHLLAIQNRAVHPFNGTSAGGWGWTHFSGSVPDGDDTPGAILALLKLNPEPTSEVLAAMENGCDWLLKLQNNDGGFPTFSKGWGKLPFDQSCADLTGHAILALSKSIDAINMGISKSKVSKYQKSVKKALRYLEKQQGSNGDWLPLWFGNQNQAQKQNPVYGTGRIAAYLSDTSECYWLSADIKNRLVRCCQEAQNFLVSVQNPDGSWGGDVGINGTVEETSLAVTALLTNPSYNRNVEQGTRWLLNHADGLEAAPIGLYFASLWYSEKLYPQLMLVEALSKVNEKLGA